MAEGKETSLDAVGVGVGNGSRNGGTVVPPSYPWSTVV